jgi:hypothetical protein
MGAVLFNVLHFSSSTSGTHHAALALRYMIIQTFTTLRLHHKDTKVRREQRVIKIDGQDTKV